MADDEKDGDVPPTRGADWEVVQLTSSTYAAAPGPERYDPDDEINEQEPSSAMFMSQHFVFPPSEHENLLIETEYSGTHSEPEVQHISAVEGAGEMEGEVSQGKSDGEKPEIPSFDNGRDLSVPDIEFDEGKALLEMNLTGEEASVFAASEPKVPSGGNEDSPKSTRSNEGDKYAGSGLPCGAWWKRHATCLYRHAKETNALWSVFVAAALMGLVILGKKWQKDKWHQLKWHMNDEKLNRVLGPAGRFKNILVRSPLTRDGAAAGR